MVATLVKLRFLLLINGLKKSPWQIVAVVLGGLYGLGILVTAIAGLIALSFAPLELARTVTVLAGAALMLIHYHEKPSIMRGGKLANFTLVCGIQFFIIDVRRIAWPVYCVGAALYLVAGLRYIWREVLRWRQARPSSAAIERVKFATPAFEA